MKPYHVIATKHFGEDDGEGSVSRSSVSSHFLVICEDEGNCIALIKEATHDKEWDKFTIEVSEDILDRPREESAEFEQVFSL